MVLLILVNCEQKRVYIISKVSGEGAHLCLRQGVARGGEGHMVMYLHSRNFISQKL